MQARNTGRRVFPQRRGAVVALLAFCLIAACGRKIVIVSGEWLRALETARILHERRQGALRRIVWPSQLLDDERSAFIYLPPGYDRPENAARRYPVVYLLHGCPGQPRDWLTRGLIHRWLDRAMADRRLRPMIVVMADGRGPGGADDCTLFLDRTDGTYPAERSLIEELIPMIDTRFRTRAVAEGRALLGISSGGYAAVNLAVRHPELFGVAASLSGYFRPAEDRAAVARILGNAPRRWERNAPLDEIGARPGAKRLAIFLDAGAADFDRGPTEAFSKRLTALSIDHILQVTPGGHTWQHWRTVLPGALEFVASRLASGADTKEATR